MRTLLIIPLDRADEAPIARYIVQAAHSRAGACLVLDLRRAGDVEPLLAELLAEFQSTAAGNGQDFAVLGGPEPPPVEGLPRFADLGEALTALCSGQHLPHEAELVLPSRIEDLPAVRSFLSDQARRLHPGAQEFELNVLVDELCQNAIENSPSNKSHYEVVFRTDEKRVRLEVSNQAAESFPPERIMQKRLDSFDDSGDYLGDRGRGLFLIARLADEMEIRTGADERITVAVEKIVRPTDGSGGS